MLSTVTYEVATKSSDLIRPSLEYMGLISSGAARWKLRTEFVQALSA